MIMETRVKISNFVHQFKTSDVYGFTKPFASNIFTGEPILNHNLTVRSFDYKIFMNLRKNVIQHFSSCLPVKYRPGKSSFACPSISRILRTAKSFFQPQNKNFITASYFKHRVPLITAAIFTLFNISDVEASFSVNNSRKVSDFFCSVIGSKENFSSHKMSLVLDHMIINERGIKSHRERLSEKTSIRGCDSLTSTTKGGEGNPKRFPRLEIGLKSNRMVLNEAAQRLGVSLRQTEDQLMRDMLQSTASFINCVGGTDGDNPTEITRSDVDTVVRTLRGNNAYSFLTGIEGENRFGTAPVRDAYFGLGHTDLIGQLDNVSGFIQKWNYNKFEVVLKSWIIDLDALAGNKAQAEAEMLLAA